MRQYSNKISLLKNSRGVYSLDPTIGCASGTENDPRGCYSDCYAAKSAKLYGYDFSKTVLRYFENEKHRKEIVLKISKIPMDFVRMGTSGDPSEDWHHTLDILSKIQYCNKQIVIITKHFNVLSDAQLNFISTVNVCINTSVSALDSFDQLQNRAAQYNRLKPFCKSILRVVTCQFNTTNEVGAALNVLQNSLLQNEQVIDTVFRTSRKNQLVKDGIIIVEDSTFLGKKATVSKNKKSVYFGKCDTCKEMCGASIETQDKPVLQKSKIVKQISLNLGIAAKAQRTLK